MIHIDRWSQALKESMRLHVTGSGEGHQHHNDMKNTYEGMEVVMIRGSKTAKKFLVNKYAGCFSRKNLFIVRTLLFEAVNNCWRGVLIRATV